MGDSNVTLVGNFTYVKDVDVPTHTVTYSWKTGFDTKLLPTTGYDLPETLTGLVKNQDYTVELGYDTFESHDEYGNVNGHYVFDGWKLDTEDVTGKTEKMGDSNITLVGNFTYVDDVDVPTHTVTYSWTQDGEAVTSKWILADHKLPVNETKYFNNQSIDIDKSVSAGATANVKDDYGNVMGTFTFSGWTLTDGNPIPADPKMDNDGIELIGEWTYKANEDYKLYHVNYSWTGNSAEVDAERTLYVDSKDYVNSEPFKVDETTYNPVEVKNNGVLVGTYTFSGWTVKNYESKEYKIDNADVEIVGTWTYTPATYTITFQDYDGTQISKTDYHYGDKVVVPGNPTRGNAGGYTYTFSGWDSAVSATVVGSKLYTAQYNATLIVIPNPPVPAVTTFTVTFVDYDGAVLKTQTVTKGADALAPVDPTRVADDTNTYTFKGWDKDYTNVQTDLTVTAQYTEVAKAVVIPDNQTPEAGLPALTLLDLASMIVSLAAFIMVLFIKKKKDDEEEDEKNENVEEVKTEDEDEDQKKSKKWIGKLVVAALGVANTIIFFVTQPLVWRFRWVDQYTVIMVVIALAGILGILFTNHNKKADKEEDNTAADNQ